MSKLREIVLRIRTSSGIRDLSYFTTEKWADLEQNFSRDFPDDGTAFIFKNNDGEDSAVFSEETLKRFVEQIAERVEESERKTKVQVKLASLRDAQSLAARLRAGPATDGNKVAFPPIVPSPERCPALMFDMFPGQDSESHSNQLPFHVRQLRHLQACQQLGIRQRDDRDVCAMQLRSQQRRHFLIRIEEPRQRAVSFRTKESQAVRQTDASGNQRPTPLLPALRSAFPR